MSLMGALNQDWLHANFFLHHRCYLHFLSFSSMPENRDSIQSEGGSEDEGSDWLASDEEGDSKALNIGRKETDKIQKKLYDVSVTN